MKRYFATLAMLLMASSVMAAQQTKTLNVNWDYPAPEESSIAGFKIYNQDANIVVDNINAALRTYSTPYTFDDAIPQAFHLVAFDKDGKQTTPSNIGIWIPKYKPLIGVGKITIEMTDVK